MGWRPLTVEPPGTTQTRRRQKRPELEKIRRQSTFDEVIGGLNEDNALFRGSALFSCGNCFECDNCFGVCPKTRYASSVRGSATSSTRLCKVVDLVKNVRAGHRDGARKI